jgi:hypothetical protein
MFEEVESIKPVTDSKLINNSSVLISRLGQLILGIKHLYDSNCAHNGYVTSGKAIELLLALGMRGGPLAEASQALEGSHQEVLDFAKFLDVYCTFCGLKANVSNNSDNNSYNNNSSMYGVNTSADVMWVPTATGQWKVVSILIAVCIQVYKCSYLYNLTNMNV